MFHNLYNSNRKIKGFTLIELLVVIAIIALLVSILLPSLNKAKFLAKSALCASNSKGIGTALHMFASDNDGRFLPRANSWAYPDWDRNGGEWPHWEGAAIKNYGSSGYPVYLGYLWKGGDEYIPAGESGAGIISCPLNEKFTADALVAETVNHCSYFYTPAYLDKSRTGCMDFHSINAVGNNALMLDAQRGWHEGGANALYGNGAVSFIRLNDIPTQTYDNSQFEISNIWSMLPTEDLFPDLN